MQLSKSSERWQGLQFCYLLFGQVGMRLLCSIAERGDNECTFVSLIYVIKCLALLTMCPLCNQFEETIHHLFVECKIAYQVWMMVARWVGTHVVYHNNLKFHLLPFNLSHFNSKRNRVWKGVWVAILWSIWSRGKKEGKLDA